MGESMRLRLPKRFWEVVKSLGLKSPLFLSSVKNTVLKSPQITQGSECKPHTRRSEFVPKVRSERTSVKAINTYAHPNGVVGKIRESNCN